jgi:hypothetical protein
MSPRHLARGVLDHELHAMSIEELSSLTEAEQDPCWRCEELKSIEDNHTWVLADLPLRRRAINLKWIFKVKRDERGNNVKHKAKLGVKDMHKGAGLIMMRCSHRWSDLIQCGYLSPWVPSKVASHII